MMKKLTVPVISLNECKQLLNKMHQLNIDNAYLGLQKGKHRLYLLPCQKATISITTKELQHRVNTI